MKKYIPFVLFGLALISTDRLLYYFGNHLVRNGFWRDDFYGELHLKKETQVYLLGDCRALVLDPNPISEALERPVKNLGLSATGLGHILLTANVLLSSQTPSSKVLILFLNDDILSASAENLKLEMARYSLWRAHLSPERIQWLESQKASQKEFPFIKHSGLWMYQGRGAELVKAAIRWFKNAPLSMFSTVGDTNQFYGKGSLVGKEHEYTPRESAGDFNTSLQLLDLTLKELNQAKVPTLIVLSPSHRIQAQDHVKARVIEEVTKLSQRNGIPLLSYLSPELEWANHSEWWGDPKHLNYEGAKKFTAVLSEDLKRILP